MEIYKSAEEIEPINGSIIKYEIIEIDETNFQQKPKSENNMNNSFSIDIEQNELSRTKFAEVYLDSIKDCLKYICLRCKTCKFSSDSIINHFKEFESTCGNVNFDMQNFNTDEKKLGSFLVGKNFSVSYSCSWCNLTLYNQSYISPHLHQHLNKFKKRMISQKRIANVYLLKNPNYNFLYSCNTCNQTFQSLNEHLQINSETCGNPLLIIKKEVDRHDDDAGNPLFNIKQEVDIDLDVGNPLFNIEKEVDRDDELNTTLSKLCEIYMNNEKKLSFMCLYCYEHHTDILSLSDHLLFHLQKKISQVNFSEKINENIMKSQFADALLTIETLSQEGTVSNNIKSEKILNEDRKQAKKKIYRCLKCNKAMRSEKCLNQHWQEFHPKILKINLNKEPEINPYVQQFLKHLSRSEKIEFVQSENSSGEDESSPIKLLNFCTKSLPNLLPQVFNNNNKNNNDIRKTCDEPNMLGIGTEIENFQNTVHNNSIKSLPTITTNNNKNIDVVDLDNIPNNIKNEQEIPENQKPVQDVSKNMDYSEECLSLEKNKSSSLSSRKYKCSVCGKQLCAKWYLRDHLLRKHTVKKSSNFKSRQRRKI